MANKSYKNLPPGFDWLADKPNTIQHHLDNPTVDLASYMRGKRLALGERIMQKRRIYLDTRYWIFIRDVFLGREQKAIHSQIVNELSRLCGDKTTVCPISYSIFSELLLQADDVTRIATGQMVDQLSDPCTIQPPHELFKREAYHFLTKNTRPSLKLIPVAHFAWTKAAFVLGDTYPSSKNIEPGLMLAIQKSIDDVLWSVTLTEMLKHLPATNLKDKLAIQSFTKEMTDAKFNAAKSDDTYESLFLDEVTGTLQGYDELSGSLMTHLAQEMGVKSEAKSEDTALGGRMLRQLIRLAFRHKKVSTELPSIEIPSSLYASVRLAPKRKYKKGDFEDFRHATLALPYCNIFLTESSLKHSLTNKPLELAQKYNCNIISDEREALAHLKTL